MISTIFIKKVTSERKANIGKMVIQKYIYNKHMLVSLEIGLKFPFRG
jgi:hypothetical protein